MSENKQQFETATVISYKS